MYPFYVDNKKVFSFSYKPDRGDIVRDDDTNKWYEVLEIEEGKGRKVYGKSTYNRLQVNDEDILYNADPDCAHDIKTQWDGIKCIKCKGWFCY